MFDGIEDIRLFFGFPPKTEYWHGAGPFDEHPEAAAVRGEIERIETNDEFHEIHKDLEGIEDPSPRAAYKRDCMRQIIDHYADQSGGE